MEASVAADAATEGAAEAPQGGGLDLSPLVDRFDGLENSLGSRLEALEAHLTPEEAEEEGLDWTQMFGADEPEEEQGQAPLNPQALQNLVQQATQSQLDQALAPLLERQQRVEVGLEAERLAAKYPELATMEGAKPVADAVQQLAESAGHPELAQNMQFVELVYKAQQADKYAAGERPVGTEQAFDMESAGGAGPPAGDELNIAERIVADRQKTEFWNNW